MHPQGAEAGIRDAREDNHQLVRTLLHPERVPSTKPVTSKNLFSRLEGALYVGVRSGIPWALLNGDAKKCLQTLPDLSIDCVVTSTPRNPDQ